MIWIVITMALSGSLGALFAHRRPENSEAFARRLMNVILWGIIPPVLYFNLVHFEFTAGTMQSLGFAWAANLLLVGVAFVVAGRFNLTRAQFGAFVCCAVMGNTAYLGYAFSAAALGTDGLEDAIIYDILVMLPSLIFIAFSIGAAYGTHAESTRERFKSYFTRNPLIFTAALALVSPEYFSPEWAREVTHYMVYMLLPGGFFAVGIIVQHESEVDGISFPPRLTGPIAAAGILKLAFMPLLLLAVSATLVKIPSAYVLQSMMPTGVNNLLLANNYGLDRKLTAGVIVWTTLVIAVVGIVIEVV